MHSPIDIANVFLRLSEPEKGDIISNLKLQKLLYYAQGYHLALYNEPLFDADIVAWQYGPVVEKVYHEFKQFGGNAIPVPDEYDIEGLSSEQLDLIKEVNSVYGQYSALKLMNMTHEETPWKTTQINNVISHEILKEYFSQNI